MSEERQVDVAVVGGGPAGIAAALAASSAGATVALIDEYAAPGGQIWRRRFDEVADAAPRSLPADARKLVARLATSRVTVLAGASVWAAPEPGVLLLTGAMPRVHARAVVLATGAYDRPVAFPGWTLPGVMTAGGAQALAKGQGVVPGRRVLLAGAGPFLLPVAAQLAASGAEVMAVAEATRRRDWLRASRRMAAHPGRLADYAMYRRKVRKIQWGHVIVRAEGKDRVRSATIAPAGPDWRPSGRERTFEVDTVCTAYGFLPSVDLARALGCELRGDAVAHDADMATSVPGVFVAGEATGIGGADLAVVEGELAGHTAAAHAALAPRAGNGAPPATARTTHDGDGAPSAARFGRDGDGTAARSDSGGAARDGEVGPVSSDGAAARAGGDGAPSSAREEASASARGGNGGAARGGAAHDGNGSTRSSAGSPAAPADLAALRARRAKLAGFAEILSDLFDPRDGLGSLPTPDTILCRCEDVTAGAVDAAVEAGATTMAALKVVTRCGQGPCQGRTCEGLVAQRLPEPERFSTRAPMRPIPLGVLIDAATDSSSTT